MVHVLVIRTSGDIQKSVNTLNRIKKRLPLLTREGMRRWGKILERDMKISATRANILPSSGLLMGKGIRYDQGPRSNVGRLFIRLYGVYLDSMAPHYVNVTRRRTRLLAWAKMARSGTIRRKALMVQSRKIKQFSIYVRPHPFIARGYRRARPKLKAVLRRVAARGIQV